MSIMLWHSLRYVYGDLYYTRNNQMPRGQDAGSLLLVLQLELYRKFPIQGYQPNLILSCHNRRSMLRNLVTWNALYYEYYNEPIIWVILYSTYVQTSTKLLDRFLTVLRINQRIGQPICFLILIDQAIRFRAFSYQLGGLYVPAFCLTHDAQRRFNYNSLL